MYGEDGTISSCTHTKNLTSHIYKNRAATMDRMTREEEKEMPKKISKQTPMGRKTQGRSKIKYMEYIE